MRTTDASDIVGKQFGKLTVIRIHHISNYAVFYECKCQCGKTCVHIRGDLTGSRKTNCGCVTHRSSERKKKSAEETFDILKGLYLRDHANMSFEQIASHMKCSVCTVRFYLTDEFKDDPECADYVTRLYLRKKRVQNTWNNICAELRKNLPHKEELKHGNTV